MIAVVVYILCAATAGACATLLARNYSKTRAPILFWSALCFAGLTLANIVLFVDLVVVRADADLRMFRDLITLVSLSVLLYSLVWEMTS